MNKFFSSYLLGALSVGIVWFFLTISACTKQEVAQPAIIVSAEKNQQDLSNAVVNVSHNSKKVNVKSTVETTHFGMISQEITIPKKDVQYIHSIGVGALVLNQSVLGKASYRYKNLEFSLYAGYNIKYSETLIGGGLTWWFPIK